MSDTEDINIDDIKKIVNKMRNNSSIRKQVKKFQKETAEPEEDYEEQEEIKQEPQEKLKKIPKAKDVKSRQKKPIKKTLDLTISDNEIDNIINNSNIKTKTDNKPKDFKEYKDEDPRLKMFLDILTKKS